MTSLPYTKLNPLKVLLLPSSTSGWWPSFQHMELLLTFKIQTISPLQLWHQFKFYFVSLSDKRVHERMQFCTCLLFSLVSLIWLLELFHLWWSYKEFGNLLRFFFFWQKSKTSFAENSNQSPNVFYVLLSRYEALIFTHLVSSFSFLMEYCSLLCFGFAVFKWKIGNCTISVE
jgi:hypothetical protein